MAHDVDKYVSECSICNSKKSPPRNVGELQQPDLPKRFFQRVGIDLMNMTPTERGNRELIVAVDHYTKYVFARPLKSGSADEVMDFILQELYFKHGAMEELWSDNGKVFTDGIADWLREWGMVKKVNTTVAHPQTNGIVERMNREMCDILKGYIDPNQGDWDVLVPAAVWMYNTSVHESTGMTPYMLITAREPRKMIHTKLLAGMKAEEKPGWLKKRRTFSNI